MPEDGGDGPPASATPLLESTTGHRCRSSACWVRLRRWWWRDKWEMDEGAAAAASGPGMDPRTSRGTSTRSNRQVHLESRAQAFVLSASPRLLSPPSSSAHDDQAPALVRPSLVGVCYTMTTIPARLARSAHISSNPQEARKRVIQLYRDWYRGVRSLQSQLLHQVIDHLLH